MDVIRVVVVDDHIAVRTGVQALLEALSDMEVVGTAGSGDEAVRLCSGTRPDVVLMDLELPGGTSGAQATRRIREASPATQVVALTSFSDRARILAVIDAGAVGYVLKAAAPGDIERAVRSAASGVAALDPVAVRAVESRSVVPPALQGLTARERSVLDLLAHGLPNREIAVRLGMSEATVKGHLTAIFRVIRVEDRTRAALWARRQGLGPDD